MFRARGIRYCVAAAASTPSKDVLQAVKITEDKLDDLSPKKITEILDKYIVGQTDGKKAVAISLRNRWRRRQLQSEDMRKEVVPKNMLLIGPTGVGKTEIARRMARITNAPFIKVESTKYTEVGFKGKDVESIIEELYANAKSKARRALEEERRTEAEEMALEIVTSAWMARNRLKSYTSSSTEKAEEEDEEDDDEEAEETPRKGKAGEEKAGSREEQRKEFKEHYTTKYKDDIVTIEVSLPPAQKPQLPGGIDAQSVGALLGLAGDGGARRQKKAVNKKVSEAMKISTQEALDKLIDENSVNQLARTLAEEEGVVFIDEIDKVVEQTGTGSSDVSSTGVQQDLLPLVEGSNVTMKDGSVIATDNILFICSGAFHTSKTSDMIAELQGRLPVRVELKPLTEADFRRILTEPKYNLLLQHTEMMKTEKIDLQFTPDGIDQLAKVTCSVNNQGQNIGARRLHTVLERVVDKYSFDCDEYEGKTVSIDAATVKEATDKLEKNVNLSKFLL
ncbi:AAA domain (dynein-related subfamily)/AAA domain (Cdc48 subfamily)/ATPase family associated with various cellular activities (AAA), putative [Angomonas deanei]|uniref:AAA domain (Dynein-related subfamily)/AAA domain (Cdc48 subfamily)/ATPase family associated with various cellular activities (AAA), putative n=1 Tax=Angomonas deanei TaxID=59799 RepID=A0A7G2CM80_9TRYP|nr:AAA domain (dynein-related subfamily)/AAA domain (Cdc48 subfamily)/ATPase family associated with various cellular activities (AAA), putative [Angomonas deanei]